MFTAPGDEAQALASKLTKTIRHFSDHAPRSQQKRIGLSEVGQPCVRRNAYKLLDWAQTNPKTDPWPSISGTAIHSWLADCFKDQYDGEENPLYLVEQLVTVNEQLSGTVDLFDIEQGMVIDHKCVGAASMKSRKRDGMTHQQRVQINLYGLGLERAGYWVEKVALAFYPLGGRLDGMHTMVEPFNRQIALDAIERLESTQTLLWQLDPEENPDHWNLIPASPSYGCLYCPWHLPKSTDASFGCRGEENAE